MTTTLGRLINEPLKFLNSTVLSFSMSAGFGSSSESSLTVELVNDCDAGDAFYPVSDGANYGVGMPVYFPDNPSVMPNCTFGGILQNWKAQKSASGLTYSVVVKDPRQLLENTLVVIDSLITGPIYHVNYYNVYAYWEQAVIYNAGCTNYGLSGSNEKGMPYYNIITTLNAMNIDVYPATYASYPYVFKIDFNTFPGIAAGSRSLPQWYRIPGPSISVLQILEDICNVLAYEFYVYLEYINGYHVIKIGLIDLNYQPASFSNIIDTFETISTEISYGQEFRNEKSKMVLTGDNVHYLVPTNTFDFFFGEDNYNGYLIPVVPYTYDDCGFWINKRIDNLNLSLATPFPSNGPYTISELDIRSAMGSYELWIDRVFDINTPGGFNSVIRNIYPQAVSNAQSIINTFTNVSSSIDSTLSIAKGFPDAMSNPSTYQEYRNRPNIVEELQKIHAFINNLGSTYYGKQWICQISNQKICKKYDAESNTMIYSDTPTNNGGWIDYTYSVLGLPEPELSYFRSDDQRITPFANFTLSYQPTVVDTLLSANSGSILSSTFSQETGIQPQEL